MPRVDAAVEVWRRDVEGLRQIVTATAEQCFGLIGVPLGDAGLPLDLSQFLADLIGHFLLVDGRYGEVEHEFVNAVSAVPMAHGDRWYDLQQTRLRNSDFLQTSPPILEAAIQCDLAHHTSHARAVLPRIESLVHVLTAVDGRFPRNEANAVTTYAGRLLARVQQFGL